MIATPIAASSSIGRLDAGGDSRKKHHENNTTQAGAKY
jgi:hypothetical protein